MREENYWLGFACCNGIGPVKFELLLLYFHSAKAAWNASEADLIRSGIGRATTAKLIVHRSSFALSEYARMLQKKNIQFMIRHGEYPSQLSQIERSPYLLFFIGSKEVLFDDQLIGVVGTRKITPYGEYITEKIVSDLVAAGYTIVSGLALGVDAIAHASALQTGGKTIAVLGSGIDICTPRENERLYNKIVMSGSVIISEFPPGYPPLKGSFPSRNRIIAGLSQGIVVTEGAEDSGSLITAQFAKMYNRKIFAIPGPITSQVSKGPHRLIKNGASLVTSAQDISIAFGKDPHIIVNHHIEGDNEDEKIVIKLLMNGPMHLDDLVKYAQRSPSTLGGILTMMEMKGYITQVTDGFFTRGKRVV